MAKAPTLPTITGQFASSTQLNAAFRAIEDSFENTLSLDGSTPNSMNADLDMNNNMILNASDIEVGGNSMLDLVNRAEDAAVSAEADATRAETAAAITQAASPYRLNTFAELASRLRYSGAVTGQLNAPADTRVDIPGLGSYLVVDSAATNWHLDYTGTGGVKLRIFPQNGKYSLDAMGVDNTGITSVHASLQRLGDRIIAEGGGTIALGIGRYRMTTTADFNWTATTGPLLGGLRIEGAGGKSSVLIHAVPTNRMVGARFLDFFELEGVAVDFAGNVTAGFATPFDIRDCRRVRAFFNTCWDSNPEIGTYTIGTGDGVATTFFLHHTTFFDRQLIPGTVTVTAGAVVLRDSEQVTPADTQSRYGELFDSAGVSRGQILYGSNNGEFAVYVAFATAPANGVPITMTAGRCDQRQFITPLNCDDVEVAHNFLTTARIKVARPGQRCMIHHNFMLGVNDNPISIVSITSVPGQDADVWVTDNTVLWPGTVGIFGGADNEDTPGNNHRSIRIERNSVYGNFAEIRFTTPGGGASQIRINDNDVQPAFIRRPSQPDFYLGTNRVLINVNAPPAGATLRDSFVERNTLRGFGDSGLIRVACTTFNLSIAGNVACQVADDDHSDLVFFAPGGLTHTGLRIVDNRGEILRLFRADDVNLVDVVIDRNQVTSGVTTANNGIMELGTNAGTNTLTRAKITNNTFRMASLTGNAVAILRLRGTGVSSVIMDGNDWDQVGTTRFNQSIRLENTHTLAVETVDFNNFGRRASRENRGQITQTTDASGDLTITHNLPDVQAGKTINAFVIRTGATTFTSFSIHTVTSTTFKARALDAAGAAIASTSMTVNWIAQN